MQYVKLISEVQIQYPPVNYITEEGVTIFNFNKNEDALIRNGFKELVYAKREANKDYKITYEETDTQIKEILEDITEEIEKEAEKNRKKAILQSSLTKREVFLALYKAKGVKPEQIRDQITNEEELIEFDYAERYYRGNPLINSIGVKLGFSSDDIDYLFLNGELPT